MSFVNGLKRSLESARGIAGKLGLHPYTVTLQAQQWDGGRPGLGTKTTTETRLLVFGQDPKVKQITEKDAVLSGGLYSNQDLKIGPLTPPFIVGGVRYDLLDPAQNPGTEFFFRLTGPGLPDSGAWYERLSDEKDSSLHIYVIVRKTAVQTP